MGFGEGKVEIKIRQSGEVILVAKSDVKKKIQELSMKFMIEKIISFENQLSYLSKPI